ncbi:ligand-gated channel protein [Methylopila jiangsuensis]|uniref:Ligand-gated channel protein n=2 Tax=Methylopila jiangsuensis TaxID=586230 RepID=A0A9W6JG88_9HYPH|nr:ligand-gated channel protein [Methylopila jiangsuensis]
MLAGMVSGALVCAPASAHERVAYDIAAQPLTQALTAYARASGLKLAYVAELTTSREAPAVKGALSPEDALRTLLANSGLTYRITGGTVTIFDLRMTDVVPMQQSDSLELDEINVEGAAVDETATGPLRGYVARRSASATKTDTPILDTPASVSVVGEKEMERRGVKSLDSAVGYISGVNTNLYGADKRYDFIAIRGFVETGMGIYRDGLQNRTNNFTGSRIEPYGMQRVEVFKGATSVLYGLNAPGGLVNLITKRPTEHPFGEVYSTGGNDHLEAGVDFGGPIDANGEWSYRLTAKAQDSKDGHEWAKDDRLFVAPALTWKPTDATSITVLADYNKRKGANRYGVLAGKGYRKTAFLGEDQFDRNDTTEKNIGYIFDHDFENGLKFHSNARYTDLDLTNKNVYFDSVFDGDPALKTDETRRVSMEVDGDLKRFVIDNHIQYDFKFDRIASRTLVGVDYSYTKANERDFRQYIPGVGLDPRNPVHCSPNCAGSIYLSSPPYVGRGTERTASVYAQEELTLDDRWILTLGGRYDDVKARSSAVFEIFGLQLPDSQEIKEEAFTTRAGLTWKITPEVSLYGNYSESFAPVTPVPTPFGGFGMPSLSGDNKPVEGVLHEAGVKYQPAGVNAMFTAAVFEIKQKNVPYYVGQQRYQIGELETRGVELEAKAEIKENLNVILAYSYLDSDIIRGELESQKGNRFQFIPKHSASAWVDYTFKGRGSFGDLTLGAGARFVGSRFADNNNSIKLASYTVFDAVLNYKITQNASFAINATNLFDKDYVSYVETFSSPDTLFYGDRRTVRATLKYTW